MAPSLRTAAKAACEGQICLRLVTAAESTEAAGGNAAVGFGSHEPVGLNLTLEH